MSLTILVILTCSFSKAGIPSTNEKIDNILKKEISYPDFAKKQKLEGVVLVSFTVKADGSVKINLTNESNNSLKDYVVKKLQSLKVVTNDSCDKTYNVKFEFKTV